MIADACYVACDKMYVDGELALSNTVNGAMKTSSPSWINILKENAENKEIANIRVYSRPLTQEEIANNYSYEQTIERTW